MRGNGTVNQKIEVKGEGVKPQDTSEERQLYQEAQALLEAHLAADARWIEKRREADEEQRWTEDLRELATRLQAQVAAGEKRAGALSQRAEELNAEARATQQRWCQAAERWEQHWASLGLPSHDPGMWPRT